MGLIHCHQGDGQLPQKAAESPGLEPLGGDVQELARSPANLTVDCPVFLRVQRRVDVCGGNARLSQGGNLILHQRDERGEHQGQSRQQQGRKLVADRFPRPGGHNAHHVPARQKGVHQRLLPGAKAAVPEILF